MADNDLSDPPGASPAPTILLTRPVAQSQRFAESLRAAHIGNVVIAPLQRIVAVGPTPELAPTAWVIFTSENAVAHAPLGAGRIAICVGARTASVARARGYDATEAGGNADAVVAAILASPPAGIGHHLHGRHVRGDIAASLRDAGIAADSQIVYDQVAATPSAAFWDALHHRQLIVPLFSPRSAQIFATHCPTPRNRAWITAFSQNVRAALPAEWQSRVSVAEVPTAAAMVAAISAQICS